MSPETDRGRRSAEVLRWVVINSEDLPGEEGAPVIEKNGYPFAFGETRLLPTAHTSMEAGKLQVLYLIEPDVLTDPNDFALEVNVFDAKSQKLAAGNEALTMTALRGGLDNRIGLLVSLDPSAFGFQKGLSYKVQAQITTSKTGAITGDYDFTM